MNNIPLVAIFSYVVILALSAFSCINMARVETTPVIAALSAPLSAEEKQSRRVVGMMGTWPKSPDYQTRFNPLSPETIRIDGGKTYAVFDPDDGYWGLPHKDGYEDVAIYCSACHTLEIVMQQRASRERWAYMLGWMVEQQNMPPMPDDQSARVLNYLSENFGPAHL